MAESQSQQELREQLQVTHGCFLGHNDGSNCYKLYRRQGGIQLWFNNVPPCMPLSEYERFLPWLDENIPDWNKEED